MSAPDKSVARVCLVGAGRMGRIRAPIIAACPRTQLVYVVDGVEVAGRALAASFGAAYLPTLGAAIDAGGIDAIVLCTPTFAHADAIREVATAGLPLFTEKPVAEDSATIASLFEFTEAKGVQLCCGFQRRFDEAYVAVRDAVSSGQIGNVTMGTVFFGDSPVPPLEFLLAGGDPFMDLSVHDLDYVRWVLDDDPVEVYATGSSSTPELAAGNVLDNATMCVTFSRGAVCTFAMSRGASYGYDQRAEFFGAAGRAAVQNQPVASITVAGPGGITHPPYKHSFGTRFAQAFAAEMTAFAGVVLDGDAWPVSPRDCIVAQACAVAAATACAQRRIVRVPSYPSPGRPLRMLQVGGGQFGTFMNAVASAPETGLWASTPCTRSSSTLYADAVVKDDVDCVYVCSPDACHKDHTITAVRAGNPVLVEKPVVGFGDVQAAWNALPEASRPAIMVGFQRRFATQFQNALRFVKAHPAPSRILVESFDPVPVDPDMAFVVRNSVCHDVDMVHWLLPNASVTWAAGSADASTSGIVLTGEAVTGDATTAVTIRYGKGHTSYLQRVTVDDTVFGYDWAPRGDVSCCELYREAYVQQFAEFRRLCGEGGAAAAALVASYAKTFASLEAAAGVLGL